MSERLYLGLVGEKGSGKGAIVTYCREKYGAASVRIADPLFETLKLLGIPPTRANLVTLSESLRRDFGQTVLAQAARHRAEASTGLFVLIDGIRLPTDVFRDLPGFHLVHVTADIRMRFERSRARGEKSGESEATFDQFAAEEQFPTERAIIETAALAETTISNNGTLAKLHANVDALVDRLLYTA